MLEDIFMNEIKKSFYCVVGGMVVALTSVYFAMPKSMRQELKSTFSNMVSKKSSCCSDECNSNK